MYNSEIVKVLRDSLDRIEVRHKALLSFTFSRCIEVNGNSYVTPQKVEVTGLERDIEILKYVISKFQE